MKGYLLIAHTKLSYLQMAFNLAVSMRHAGTKHKIALVTDLNLNWLRDSSGKVAPEVFDHVIKIPKDLKEIIKPFPFYLKTRLPELTPFEDTVYLDVDALFLKSPDYLFDLYGDFGMIVNWKVPGHTKEPRKTWAKPPELFAYYGFDPNGWFYDTNSSVIRFGKNDLSKRIFEKAEYYYAEHFYPKYYHQGFGHYPDELAFNSALADVQPEPELQLNNPIKFMHSGSKRTHDELAEILDSECFGLYGNASVTHPLLYRTYNRLVMDQGREYHRYYGFRVEASTKVANGHDSRPRYQGIRGRETE